jgi:hypothetical protein
MVNIQIEIQLLIKVFLRYLKEEKKEKKEMLLLMKINSLLIMMKDIQFLLKK